MKSQLKNHGPAFGELETREKLDDAQIEARARALLGQLTLDEKIKMMSGDEPFWSGMAPGWRGQYHGWASRACASPTARAG
jgi:hypothetical protein